MRKAGTKKRAPARPGPKPRGLVKKTVTMSKARAAAIKRAVADGKAPTESSYIESALAAFDTLEAYDELLEQWRRETGPATTAEAEWAEHAVQEAMSGRARFVE